jgi:parallel beta-helix repeat protein
MTVPSNAGMVILKQCSGITVQNLDLRANTHGISLYNTNETTIYGNKISNNKCGMALYHSHSNSIAGNQITSNSGNGINLGGSNGTIISNNRIESNQYGIYDSYSSSSNTFISSNQIVANGVTGISCYSNCTVIDNYIFANAQNGIWISDISNSVVTRNNLTLNAGAGIHFVEGTNSMINRNYISKNKMGIVIGYASENKIMSNDIVENSQWGIRIEGYAKNNLIYLNNFVNNNNSIQASVKPIWVYLGDERYVDNLNSGLPQQVAGYANFWDNDTHGNYWSDHNPETLGSSVSNTPYVIDDNNQDKHPLSAPLESAALELPSIKPPLRASVCCCTLKNTRKSRGDKA